MALGASFSENDAFVRPSYAPGWIGKRISSPRPAACPDGRMKISVNACRLGTACLHRAGWAFANVERHRLPVYPLPKGESDECCCRVSKGSGWRVSELATRVKGREVMRVSQQAGSFVATASG